MVMCTRNPMGSRDIPQDPMWDPKGYRRIPRHPAACHNIPGGISRYSMGSYLGSRAMSWDPMGFTRKLPREPCVGAHEILWDAMALGVGLRIEYGIGLSRELAGLHGSLQELGETRGTKKLKRQLADHTESTETHSTYVGTRGHANDLVASRGTTRNLSLIHI